MTDTIGSYDARAGELADSYERVNAADLHEGLFGALARRPDPLVLDIGAGSGRDSAWFAQQGSSVVAVEPAAYMRAEGRRRHSGEEIRWVTDRLPALPEIHRLGLSFDAILLCAVWMEWRRLRLKQDQQVREWAGAR